MPKLATGHHFFRTRKATPRIRAAAATATPPATSIGVKFSKGQGPRPPGPPLGASPSSTPSPGPLGSGATSGVLGAAGAGFRLLWLLRRAGSALAGVLLLCLGLLLSWLRGRGLPVHGSRGSGLGCGLSVGLGAVGRLPSGLHAGCMGGLCRVRGGRQASGPQQLRTVHPWASYGPGGETQ